VVTQEVSRLVARSLRIPRARTARGLRADCARRAHVLRVGGTSVAVDGLPAGRAWGAHGSRKGRAEYKSSTTIVLESNLFSSLGIATPCGPSHRTYSR
jgi:hypothetical protein